MTQAAVDDVVGGVEPANLLGLSRSAHDAARGGAEALEASESLGLVLRRLGRRDAEVLRWVHLEFLPAREVARRRRCSPQSVLGLVWDALWAARRVALNLRLEGAL